MSELFLLPKPRDWNTFEDIVCDIMRAEYKQNNFQRYGRHGQKQHGVDIAGLTSSADLIGAQCKHHSDGTSSVADLKKEIAEANNFTPALNKYIFYISQNTDPTLQSFIMQESKDRIKKGAFPIEIKFWDDISKDLSNYPNLLYKHFGKYFSVSAATNSQNIITQKPFSAVWPVSRTQLKKVVESNIKSIFKVDSYEITLGLKSFKDYDFQNKVDLAIDISEVIDANVDGSNFNNMLDTFSNVKNVLSDTFFSKNINLIIKTRLTAAIAFGWVFREVTGFNVTTVAEDLIYTTNNVPPASHNIVMKTPVILDTKSDSIAVILNLTGNREALDLVLQNIESQKIQSKAVFQYESKSRILNSAQALATAIMISDNLKELMSSSEIKEIHLYPIVPAGLEVLTASKLNAIKPIFIYYLDSDRKTYKLGGILRNES